MLHQRCLPRASGPANSFRVLPSASRPVKPAGTLQNRRRTICGGGPGGRRHGTNADAANANHFDVVTPHTPNGQEIAKLVADNLMPPRP